MTHFCQIVCPVCVYAGVIQATERDEFSYQEMIAHLSLCALEVRPVLTRGSHHAIEANTRFVFVGKTACYGVG